ncbi:MAG TPA: hypothetical protein VHC95_07200 [Opitutales bacterium]|nr:hypothetical protein [Opitutales bacterium]
MPSHGTPKLTSGITDFPDPKSLIRVLLNGLVQRNRAEWMAAYLAALAKNPDAAS